MTRLVRAVEMFDKKSDELVKEYELRGVDLEFLQALFKQDKDDPMYECFRINQKQAEQLSPFVSGEIDTEKYNCLLACYTDDDKA